MASNLHLTSQGRVYMASQQPKPIKLQLSLKLNKVSPNPTKILNLKITLPQIKTSKKLIWSFSKT